MISLIKTIYPTGLGIGNKQTDSTTNNSSKTQRITKNRAKAIATTVDKIRFRRKTQSTIIISI